MDLKNTNTSNTMDSTPKIIENKPKKEKKKKKKKKNRCSHPDCNRKLTLASVECKCKLKFCGLHRLPHQHKCNYVSKVNEKDIMTKCGLGGGNFKQLEVI